MPPLTRKVLLIGWDAADWKIIHPLIDSGKMPTLKRFIEEGVSGNLATLDPPLSPIMWTSIGTGKTADKHGVLGFTQPRRDGLGIQPVLSSSRKVKALWNILMQEGFKTHVIGWWPSHPAEKLNGVSISNFFHHVTGPVNQPNPMPPGSVQPERLAATLEELRIHPHELTAQHILPFVPNAATIDQRQDPRLYGVAKITAECATVQAAATWVMENEPWDFMAVYFDAIDHYCHGYMNFHPPYRQGIPRKLFENYQDVVTGGYLFHDMMLERLLDLAGPETTVILCSDHGFHSDHLRPGSVPDEPAGPVIEHRNYGIIAMHGPGIAKDELIFGASLLDITPTILSLFGLPVGADMDGKPLVSAFERPMIPKVIESWETVKGDSGMMNKEQLGDPWAEQAALEQLVELGYIDPPDQDAQKAINSCQRESKFYLACTFLYKNAHSKALPLLEELFEEQPDQTRFGLRLAKCYQMLGKISEAREVTDRTISAWEEHRLEKEREIREKTKELGQPEIDSNSPPQRPAPALDLLQGSLLLAEGKPEEALIALQRAQKALPRMPALHLRLGQTYLRMNRLQDAEEALFQALEIDPECAEAFHGLSTVYLRMRYYQEAYEAAATSLGLIFHNPSAHYNLGEATFRLGDFKGAETSWLNCINQAPGMKKAHDKLITLYQRFLPDPLKVLEHQCFIAEKIIPYQNTLKGEQPTKNDNLRPEKENTGRITEVDCTKKFNLPSAEVITIVSGLPRSGTSMMMQILTQGGLPPLTDILREADTNNPKGYYEFEPVKSLSRGQFDWLQDAKGKVVKVIAQLLPALPTNYHYRIIFMQRDMNEILQSQRTMLAELHRKQEENSQSLAASYQAQLTRLESFLNKQSNMEVLHIAHRDVLSNPMAQVQRVATFLDIPFDTENAAAAVDPSLYRAK
ncbi:MAG: alkaline phosphatase family protein [Proteobacteria bacterium]|nr:alkaline phosphatase family protein [Pseudomonadota bacterium]MBU1715117.1 alkaline phosphatase family protein [Pseudomonadota bacterium]